MDSPPAAVPRATALAALTSLPGVNTASGVASAAAHAATTGRVLPVLPELAELLPARGLRRGSTVAVRNSTSLLLALLAAATSSGSWVAVVGMPDLGVAAARELGVELARLALVPDPGADVAAVTAALLDGMDVVVVGAAAQPAGGVHPRVAHRLSARARNREAVLLAHGPWPGAEVELSCRTRSWSGAGAGDGHLRGRQVEVRTRGRGAAARPGGGGLLLPGPGGAVAPGDVPVAAVREVG
ncbi:hypothetical protein EWH70_18160 [Amycolatopsis suaedae]|uniref:Uncharacterized protein n=1 Tax=Amycolatopsis suaedae TaxID=2510978 RepID=A0A4Q7J5P9_9PSEU|nr:hypothetical protein EWH70_18160 [Amycolatopsis suaedae]